jgi:hypothetical protein
MVRNIYPNGAMIYRLDRAKSSVCRALSSLFISRAEFSVAIKTAKAAATLPLMKKV